jgi:hypothetical protein
VTLTERAVKFIRSVAVKMASFRLTDLRGV